MPNTTPPSTLPKTSEEPSQSTVRISLLTHTNALNRVLPLKALDTCRAQPGLPPVRFPHLHLHQQLFTGHTASGLPVCHGGKKTPPEQSPRLAVLLRTLPKLTGRGCSCGGSRCVPAVGGECRGILASLAGSGVPGWWEGWTTGIGTSLESPGPPVRHSTPASSPHTAIYNRTATTVSSTTVKWCTSLSVCSPG